MGVISEQAAPPAADEKSELGVEQTPEEVAAAEVVADAPAAPIGDAPGEGAAIGSEAWIDDPTTDPKALQDYLSGKLDAPANAEVADAEAEAAPAEAPPPADEPVIDFKFTEGADAETFKTEEAKYLDLVEMTPELQTILDHKNAEIEQLSSATAAFKGDESATRHMEAFDKLVEFREDPETKTFVPDTSGIIGLLEKEYPHELPQVVADINSQPSKKYQGMTMFQEFIRDYANLDAPAMERLDYFLHNGGEMPIPAFVPEGIHPTLAEAFWTAADREELVVKIDGANWTLSQDPEATEAEKEGARANLKTLNNRLNQIQTGLNANKQRVEGIKAQQLNQQTAIQHEAVDRFVETTRGIINIIAQKSTAGLEMMEASGGRITGLGYATLIENAFSDNDGYAKFYQEELAKEGITADWPKAFATRDRLFAAETKLISLEKSQAHPRAIETAKKEKDTVIKELLALAHEAGGKINAKVVSGATQKLAALVATAPRTAAVRPKTAAEGVRRAPTTNYDADPSWTPEKLREEQRRLARATQGDLSGFQ